MLSAATSKRRLRLWLGLFFLALAVPTTVLVRQAYTQLKWEAFYHYRALAEELVVRIDSRLSELIKDQENRRFADYGFLVVAGDPSSSFLQRSPLSDFPVRSSVPGLLGFFQVNAEGEFSTPLLPQPGADPEAYGVSAAELEQRRKLADRLRGILKPTRLARERAGQAAEPAERGRAAPSGPKTPRDRLGDSGAAAASRKSDSGEGRAAPLNRDFASSYDIEDQLDTPSRALPGQMRVEELELDERYQAQAPPAEAALQAFAEGKRSEARVSRKERSVLPEPSLQDLEKKPAADTAGTADLTIDVFESEIDPFELSLFDGAHFVLYRKVWRDGSRYIQGAIIELEPFVRGVVEETFLQTSLSRMSDLVVAYEGNVLRVLSGRSQRANVYYGQEDLEGSLLYRSRLSSPLSELELILSITHLPPGPGGPIVYWIAALLVLVLVGGTYLTYRLGSGQIELARQQQDFVSAVSHELKTPLTSIRMYSEMLREGWASEEKQRSYYNYIHDESERLSRLIGNVLQLARLTRNELQVDAKAVSVAEILDLIRNKTGAQVERAGFVLELDCEPQLEPLVLRLDPDCVSQIFINLVDNALKFATRAKIRRIDVGCRLTGPGQSKVTFSVRDYGPGIARDQMKKIFKLFFRSEDELTRETVGTGIGLALVQQLAQRMGGSVDVVNRDPGAEFRITFSPTKDG